MEKVKKNYVNNRNGYISLLLILAIAAAAVAELFVIMSDRANSGHAISIIDDIMLYSELAVALLIVMFILSAFLKGQASAIIMDVLRFAAVALLCMCMYYVLIERTDLMGFVWFSDLESGNQNSVDALNYGVIAVALYVVAIIACAVSGGFDLVTSIRKRRTREDVVAEIAVLNKELATMPADYAAEGAAASVTEDVLEPTGDEFIDSLSAEERKEFYNLFIMKGSCIEGVPPYGVRGDNKEFFTLAFVKIGKLNNIASEGLIAKMHKQL